jgi:hypothetical protein
MAQPYRHVDKASRLLYVGMRMSALRQLRRTRSTPGGSENNGRGIKNLPCPGTPTRYPAVMSSALEKDEAKCRVIEGHWP